MARPRIYRNNAEKQAAYRQRKQLESGNNRNSGKECNHFYEPAPDEDPVSYGDIPHGLTYREAVAELKRQIGAILERDGAWIMEDNKKITDLIVERDNLRAERDYWFNLKLNAELNAMFGESATNANYNEKNDELTSILKEDPGAIGEIRRAFWKRYNTDTPGNPHADEEKMKRLNRHLDRVNGK